MKKTTKKKAGRGAKPGNRNAAKPEEVRKSRVLTLRVTPKRAETYRREAERRFIPLSEWLQEACDRSAGLEPE